jgi:hypothetical protein
VWTRLYHARREFLALAAKFQKRAQAVGGVDGAIRLAWASKAIPRAKGTGPNK